jgi:hypothetical protein
MEAAGKRSVHALNANHNDHLAEAGVEVESETACMGISALAVAASTDQP